MHQSLLFLAEKEISWPKCYGELKTKKRITQDNLLFNKGLQRNQKALTGH